MRYGMNFIKRLLITIAAIVVCTMFKTRTVQAIAPSELVTVPDYMMEVEYTVQYDPAQDMQTVYVNSDNATNKVIFYYHGGAYITGLIDQHWGLINMIAKATDAEIIVPIYPLAPAHNANDVYARVVIQYASWKLVNMDKQVYFIGDSAGGGMAVGISQRVRDLGFPGPDKLVLISPWVDVSMTNPSIYFYDDPSNGAFVLKTVGNLWATGAGVDPTDGRVSVLYADCHGLPSTYIIAGSVDCLFPDIMRFKDKLEASGVSVQMYAAQGLCHDYPVLYYYLCQGEVQSIAEFLS